MATLYNTTICSWWIFILVATVETIKYGCVDGIRTLDENDFGPKPKGTVKTIEVPVDGDLIDCVDIYKQPALDNLLIKKLEMEPSLSYQRVFNKTNNPLFDKTKNRLPKQIQNWLKYGQCPEGTIPIRRNWNNNGTIFRKGLRNDLHEYATADHRGSIHHGVGATFSVWNPHVSGIEFSLAQLWVVSGNGSDLNTIEAGWMVYPNKYRDSRTRFFTFWTADGYRHGCYNHDCQGPGFIQTTRRFCLGCPISPVSQYRGQIHDIRITVTRDWVTGHWRLYYGNLELGYFPQQIFPTLRYGADNKVDFGGEIINTRYQGRHTTTQMGSGHFSAEGPGRASYVSNIITVNERHEVVDASLNPFSTYPGCYDISLRPPGTRYGTYFYYGGPGYSRHCP